MPWLIRVIETSPGLSNLVIVLNLRRPNQARVIKVSENM